MDGSIVSAAKWFGICLIISALIIVIGFNVMMDKSVQRLGRSIENAASYSRTKVSFPNSLSPSLRSSGPFGIDLSPNMNVDTCIPPSSKMLAWIASTPSTIAVSAAAVELKRWSNTVCHRSLHRVM